jgi:exo-1,4-beta-D-glucosaminidase
MFEAFGRNQGEATGVIQWMLNNGWPSLIWHLYDYYLRPGAGYYGVKQANQPLHVQYSSSDGAVSVVNHTLQASEKLEAIAETYSLDGRRIDRRAAWVTVAGESSRVALTLPPAPQTCFLRLRLRSAEGVIGAPNVYWLSAKPDVLDLHSANWYTTPESNYADFSALSQLPRAIVTATPAFHRTTTEGFAQVRVTNRSNHIAFMVRLQIRAGKSGEEVLPVWWSDNYLTLMPGESRTLSARYRLRDLDPHPPALSVTGWNFGQ